jgi:hypothetical protein
LVAFTHVHGAFSLIVKEFQRLSAFTAVVARIGTLWDALANPALPHDRINTGARAIWAKRDQRPQPVEAFMRPRPTPDALGGEIELFALHA